MALIKKPLLQLWHAWSPLRWKLRYLQDISHNKSFTSKGRYYITSFSLFCAQAECISCFALMNLSSSICSAIRSGSAVDVT